MGVDEGALLPISLLLSENGLGQRINLGLHAEAPVIFQKNLSAHHGILLGGRVLAVKAVLDISEGLINILEDAVVVGIGGDVVLQLCH